ncbi:hypothetical protein METBIDRAFT_34958 [Metschnikowia bicuspidata var. bicuspidata NRRL YB-4993]|uniref:LicD/FKTN/FKRP nucleotidyltransferase domain-containing protein n=1 Tax=Metschnikowia bicuspidata var. bicuspidata NRRL YB-4993 TaxID=869754 RepID=A0A1A0HJK6_9ASCO|nr:hypothetical protein METBIDRAFT_34958 [Metschnikowia bicuspidata var. bicuspidata NRRL YB-4993]OBA24195.1 hypothetical protein METBIDRAFT_34958 [Metschnikowia bicuspidata var. bicuspidata NRRL YB-4993]
MVITIRRRYIQVSVVIALLFMLILTLLLKHSHAVNKSLNYIDSLSLSLFSTQNKDPTVHSLFNEKVTQILEHKQRADPEDKYWPIDTELTIEQTHLTVPHWFAQPVSARPVTMPFDPRFTLAVYYSYLSRHPEILEKGEMPFHWSDWVDMTPLNKHFFSLNKDKFSCSNFDMRQYHEAKWPDKEDERRKEVFDPETFCRKAGDVESNGLGFVIDKYCGRTTDELVILLGKAYLHTLAPNPSSVIFLTKEGSYSVPLARDPSRMLENKMVAEYMHANDMSMEINTLKEFRQLQAAVPPLVSDVFREYEVHLKHEDFVYEPSQVLKELEEKRSSGTIDSQELSYLESVEYSVEMKDNPSKYFREARIFDTKLGDHYDWRFFRGFKLGSQEQANTLHRLVRTWLSFTRKQGITTWMAHGSLLSWYWNGVAFPWDNDIDVQMPVMSLHKLSLKFNQSLIVEDGEDGFGRYFLDSGTFITTRNRNNGNNNIDARFIDVDSGLYIDITGLAVSSDPSPERYHDTLPKDYQKDDHPSAEVNNLLQVYNCRNKHFLSLTELSPLVKTFVEGEVAYVPKRYSDILTIEYTGMGMIQNFFLGHLFIPRLKLWIHQDLLRFFTRHKEEWKAFYLAPADSHEVLDIPKTSGKLTNNEIKILLGLKDEDFLDLLLADDLLITYILTRDMTSMHETEITRLLFGKTTQDIVENAPDFKPLMYEPSLYRANRDFITFEARVAKFQEFQDKMERENAENAEKAES